MGGRAWKQDEIKLLKELIRSEKSPSYIASRLGRTESAVRIKATRIGLDIQRYKTEYLSTYALSNIMQIECKTIIRWHELGLKVQKNGEFYLHSHKDIITFLKNHQDLWDATRGDMYLVNQEPWFQAKYEADLQKKKEAENRKCKWNEYDARELVRLRDKGWDYTELARKYGRTKRACRVKVCQERKKQREEVGRIRQHERVCR